MGQLIEMNGTQTMSSLDFLNNLINPSRVSAGESEVESRHFIAKIEDEIDDLGVAETFYVTTSQGAKRPVKGYRLTMEQMTLVGMRESKSVRRSVLAKLKELEDSPRQLSHVEQIKGLLAAGLLTVAEAEAAVLRSVGMRQLPVSKPATPRKTTRAKAVSHVMTFEQAIAEFVNTLSGTGCMPTEDAYLMFCEMYGTNMARRNKFVSAVRELEVEKRSIRFDGVSKQGFLFH